MACFTQSIAKNNMVQHDAQSDGDGTRERTNREKSEHAPCGKDVFEQLVDHNELPCICIFEGRR